MSLELDNPFSVKYKRDSRYFRLFVSSLFEFEYGAGMRKYRSDTAARYRWNRRSEKQSEKSDEEGKKINRNQIESRIRWDWTGFNLCVVYFENRAGKIERNFVRVDNTIQIPSNK